MGGMRGWAMRLLSLFRRRQLDERLDDELGFHLEMAARDLEARGLSPQQARRQARLAFGPGGSTEPLKERYRTQRGVPALETLGRDLRYALRMMRKSPGFTAVALLSLAFGIGTNCAIFSVADALLWKPLPVAGAERLVVLGRREGGEAVRLFSYPAFRRLAEADAAMSDGGSAGSAGSATAEARSATGEAGSAGSAGSPTTGAGSATAGVVAVSSEFETVVRPETAPPPQADLGAAGAQETAVAQLVSGNFFSVLAVGTAVGRTFGAADDLPPDGQPLAVMSYGYWQRRFGRDPAVVGRVLRVNGAALTVIGVAARGFFGVAADQAPDLFLPLTLRTAVKYQGDTMTDGPVTQGAPVWREVNLHWLNLVARRRPGAGLAQTSAALNVLFEREKQAQAASRPESEPSARRALLAQRIEVAAAASGLGESRGRLGRPLVILLAVAGLVLLIACANLANLLLARADRRRKEMAVRLGIGAGRGRLLRQLLTESLLLAGLGGALSLLFAYWGSRFLVGLVATADAPLALDVALDGRKLAFAAAAALLTGLGFGLAPALRATGVDLAASLRAGAGTLGDGGQGRRRMPLRRLLVAAQIAMSLLLLVGAGLFVRSLQNLMRVDTGFERDRLLQVTIGPRLLDYDDRRLAALYERLVARLEALPGVRSASLSLYGLMTTDGRDGDVVIPGYVSRVEEDMAAALSVVTPRYFETTGIRLLGGRGFTAGDREGAPEVVVVNQAFARRFFARGPVLGRRFGFSPKRSSQFEVVGVVRDSKVHRLGETTAPMVYFAAAQEIEALHDVQVRVAGSATAAVAAELRGAIAEVSPGLPVFAITTMGEQLARSLARERAVARLTGFFGLLALVLAAIGLYGVMSYSVARRTNEIGLRLALGAPRRQVLGLVLRETAQLIAIGLAAGLAAALAGTRVAASQLFGISAHDPATLAVATLAMAAVALLAGFLPARRAAATDPMAALRYE
jgi:predicted permease